MSGYINELISSVDQKVIGGMYSLKYNEEDSTSENQSTKKRGVCCILKY